MIRAFVALDLDATSLRRVARVIDRLRMASGAPSAAWTAPSKVHVTLKFIEKFPADGVEPLGKALAELVDPAAAPRPSACSIQAFPSIERAKVIVCELVDLGGDLAKLAGEVDRLARKHGAAPERRAFRPHVTLARLKRPYDARKWLRAEFAEVAGEFTAAALTFYRSELGADADGTSRYVPLARLPYITRTQTS